MLERLLPRLGWAKPELAQVCSELVAFAPKWALKARRWAKIGATVGDSCEEADVDGPKPVKRLSIAQNSVPLALMLNANFGTKFRTNLGMLPGDPPKIDLL